MNYKGFWIEQNDFLEYEVYGEFESLEDAKASIDDSEKDDE